MTIKMWCLQITVSNPVSLPPHPFSTYVYKGVAVVRVLTNDVGCISPALGWGLTVSSTLTDSSSNVK